MGFGPGASEDIQTEMWSWEEGQSEAGRAENDLGGRRRRRNTSCSSGVLPRSGDKREGSSDQPRALGLNPRAARRPLYPGAPSWAAGDSAQSLPSNAKSAGGRGSARIRCQSQGSVSLKWRLPLQGPQRAFGRGSRLRFSQTCPLALLLPWAWLQVTAVIQGDGVGRSEPLIRTVERLD